MIERICHCTGVASVACSLRIARSSIDYPKSNQSMYAGCESFLFGFLRGPGRATRANMAPVHYEAQTQVIVACAVIAQPFRNLPYSRRRIRRLASSSSSHAWLSAVAWRCCVRTCLLTVRSMVIGSVLVSPTKQPTPLPPPVSLSSACSFARCSRAHAELPGRSLRDARALPRHSRALHLRSARAAPRCVSLLHVWRAKEL